MPHGLETKRQELMIDNTQIDISKCAKIDSMSDFIMQVDGFSVKLVYLHYLHSNIMALSSLVISLSFARYVLWFSSFTIQGISK